MSLEKFKSKYMGAESKWNFDKFSIICKKCGSSRVEFNGHIELEYGYYDSVSIEGGIVVKCHSCGNAFKIWCDDYQVSLNKSGKGRLKEISEEISKPYFEKLNKEYYSSNKKKRKELKKSKK